MRSKRMWMGLLCVASFVATSAAGTTTIFADDFSGDGGLLNGTTPDVTTDAVAWEAGDTFLDDGTAGTTVAGGPNGQAAHLAFTPVAGIYTAEVTILNDQPNWIGFGFMPASPPGGDWTATDFSVRHSNNGAHAWMLTRNSAGGNDQEGFNGPSTSNNAFGGDIVSPGTGVTMQIVLDTRLATWTAEYVLNGASQGVFNLPASANTDIAGIGFSHDRSSEANAGGLLRNFSLTYIPEPTTALLLGIGGLALLRRRP